MKIAVWNSSSFVGSNFATYLLQTTKHDLCLFLPTKCQDVSHLMAALASRSRVTYQVGDDPAASLARLHIEKPDTILCIDQFPSFLEDRYNTIFLGRDPTVCGPSKTFLYGNAFGPRQPLETGLARSIIAESWNGHDSSAIYIKDLFEQFMLFLERGDRFGVAAESAISETDFKSAMAGQASTKMQNAIVHTYAWYKGNPWYQVKQE